MPSICVASPVPMAQTSRFDSFGVVLLAATALSHPAIDVKVCKLVIVSNEGKISTRTNESTRLGPFTHCHWHHRLRFSSRNLKMYNVLKFRIVQVSRLRGDHWQLWKSMEEEHHFSKPDRQNLPHYLHSDRFFWCSSFVKKNSEPFFFKKLKYDFITYYLAKL
jgi:hypothetical protein